MHGGNDEGSTTGGPFQQRFLATVRKRGSEGDGETCGWRLVRGRETRAQQECGSLAPREEYRLAERDDYTSKILGRGQRGQVLCGAISESFVWHLRRAMGVKAERVGIFGDARSISASGAAG